MKIGDWVNTYCDACGGNWARMLMTGIKRWNKALWDAMPDREYGFDELCAILEANGIVFEK